MTPISFFLIRQQIFIVGDAFAQFLVLRLDFLAFQTLQSAQLHVQNGLARYIGEPELLHQLLFRIVVSLADGSDDLVDIVEGNPQTF